MSDILKKLQIKKFFKFLTKYKDKLENLETLSDDDVECYLFIFTQIFYSLWCWFEKVDINKEFKEEINSMKKTDFYIIANRIKHGNLMFFYINEISESLTVNFETGSVVDRNSDFINTLRTVTFEDNDFKRDDIDIISLVKENYKKTSKMKNEIVLYLEKKENETK